MKKLVQSLFILLFVAVNAIAQERTVTGTVTSAEDGLPLPGASVKLKNGNIATQTDSKGQFSISVPSTNSVLVVSFIGTETKEVTVSNSRSLNIALAADNKQLSEVVIVGYGTQIKKNVTSAISSVSAQDIKEQPVPDIAQALQGRLAGVQVSAGSGRPGAPINVAVRGRSSLLAGNKPLYVVDGVILPSNNNFIPSDPVANPDRDISPLANINPEDIESIDVLKDAAAAAIYGSRGSNGVILITTKSGKKGGKSSINVNTYTGYQSLTNVREVLNASEYRTMYNEALVNRGLPTLFTQAQINNPDNNVNWVDQVVSDDSRVNSFQLSLTSGGNEKTQFYSSFNYFNQDGALKKGSFDRYAIRTNVTHNINDFIRFGSNLSLSRTLRNETPIDNSIYSPFPRALIARPDQPIFNPDGTFAINSFGNPSHMFQSDDLINLSNIFNSSFVEFKILPELRFKSSVGIDYSYLDQRTYDPITSLPGVGSNGAASSGYVQTQNIVTTQTLSYNKFFFNDKLNLDATAVHEFQWNDRENNRLTGTNFPSDLTPYLTSAAQIATGTASITQFRIESMLARLNLAWDEKYLLGASIRRDGSTKFPDKGRYGYFPSVSAGWIISEESFFQGLDFINLMKLRTSYGETGNQEGIGNFTSRRLIGGGFNYDDTPGFALSTIGSPDLRWETTRQFDIGLEVSFLNSRIDFSADYYKKKTFDLLQNRPIPATTGFTSILENVGNLEGEGFDFLISSRNLIGAFKWNTSLNLSTYKNTVTALFNDQPIDAGFVVRTAVGQPLGSFFLIKSLGVDPATGDMRFEDINNSNSINADDRQFMGNPLPSLYGGLTNNFSYKNFDLGIFFQFSYGNDIYNLNAEGVGGSASLGGQVSATAPAANIFRDVFENRWTPTNTNAKYPRAVGGTQGIFNNQRSSRYLEDGSYLRLKNITLGYNLPKNVTSKLRINNARVFVTGQNILTFTNYTGFDPEVSSTFSIANTGVDQGTIPQFKTFSFGLNVGL
ncbi:SusC/RagA family TonB-linked outer membrane protein [Pedobacter glucosidilyticus]|uniref:SusC/RagA family TonB-linked outer membrane protein n=1 Tax=Pedobacter glucosidilyticus TaxID=1122941 RepID=UPI0026F14416|nr:TonB-dependent receptor [Pedobacter glucosidilyticus]